MDGTEMSQRVDSTAPVDTRDQCYGLLGRASPLRIVVDDDLREGDWYVVRGLTSKERLEARLKRARLAAEQDERNALAQQATSQVEPIVEIDRTCIP